MLKNSNAATHTNEQSELWFKAEMTHRQFLALSHKLMTADIENEILNHVFWVNKLSSALHLNLSEVEKWLNNAWNTENVLDGNHNIIDNTGQSFALQWAFPQAYYSTFGTLLAHFKALGYTETSHAAVLKKFGQLAGEKKLPESICFYSSGSMEQVTYHNLLKPLNIKPIEFDITNQKTIDNHICQFLKATREIKLIDKAADFRFKNKNGTPKQKLSSTNWQRVAETLGNTTIMDLLYRKRIKANYQDIDTFTYEGFKGKEVLTNLNNIVNRLNLVNEAYIAKAIGLKEFINMSDRHLKKVDNPILTKRRKIISSLMTA